VNISTAQSSPSFRKSSANQCSLPCSTKSRQLQRTYQASEILFPPDHPDSIYPHRKHPDIRIARRGATIASLARRISERSVKRGLRTTLLTQAKRLERLAEARLKDSRRAEDEDQKEE